MDRSMYVIVLEYVSIVVAQEFYILELKVTCMCRMCTYTPAKNFSISAFEQLDQVTFPGPRAGDIRNLSGSQLFPSFVSPS